MVILWVLPAVALVFVAAAYFSARKLLVKGKWQDILGFALECAAFLLLACLCLILWVRLG
jgi:hypothetical protein